MTRAEKKSWLRGQQNKNFRFGAYELLISKVADKKVAFIESINGIQHKHNYFKIEEAYDYVNYKLSLNKRLAEQRNEIDLKLASPEYKNQKNSYDDTVAELLEFLNENVLQGIDDSTYMVLFDDEKYIKIEFASIGSITINIRSSESFSFISIDTGTLRQILTPIDANASEMYIAFGRLLEQNNLSSQGEYDCESLGEILARYHDMRLQLNKFTVTASSDIQFPVTQQDIIDFMSVATDGQAMIIPLQDHADRKRALYIERSSRVSYLIEARSFRECPETGEDIMQEEYWTRINKFTSNYTENIKIVKRIYEALA